MQDLTDFEHKVEKSKKLTFAHKLAKLVKSCINGWTDLQVDLSELIAAHRIYMNPNFIVTAVLFNEISAYYSRVSKFSKVKLWQH